MCRTHSWKHFQLSILVLFRSSGFDSVSSIGGQESGPYAMFADPESVSLNMQCVFDHPHVSSSVFRRSELFQNKPTCLLSYKNGLSADNY